MRFNLLELLTALGIGSVLAKLADWLVTRRRSRVDAYREAIGAIEQAMRQIADLSEQLTSAHLEIAGLRVELGDVKEEFARYRAQQNGEAERDA